MPVNLNNLRAKRSALQRKDCAALAAAHVHIYGLGSDYTAEELQAIFDIQVALLDAIESSAESESGLTAIRGSLLNELSSADVDLANQILSGDFVDPAAADNPWSLRKVILFQFVRG